jgi:hypothetical protein
MADNKQLLTTIKVAEDGAVEAVFVHEFKPVPHTDGKPIIRGIQVDDFEELEALKQDPDLFVYKDSKVRRRNDDEMRSKVRKIWERIKTGDVQRCKDDLVDRFPQYFTAEELEEVERPEEAVKRLNQEIKELRAGR